MVTQTYTSCLYGRSVSISTLCSNTYVLTVDTNVFSTFKKICLEIMKLKNIEFSKKKYGKIKYSCPGETLTLSQYRYITNLFRLQVL